MDPPGRKDTSDRMTIIENDEPLDILDLRIVNKNNNQDQKLQKLS